MPKADPPKRDKSEKATRFPSPELTKPADKTYAQKMSQTVLEEKPDSTCPIVAVPERTAIARARKRSAPEGIGEQRLPMMVATNIANMCQAFTDRPSGHGSSQIPTRRMRGIAQRNVGTFFHHIIDLLGVRGK